MQVTPTSDLKVGVQVKVKKNGCMGVKKMGVKKCIKKEGIKKSG